MVEITSSPLAHPDPAHHRPVPFTRAYICPDARAAADEVLASGWVTTGRRAVAVSSCTAALELSLRALRLERGSRVVMSTMTFCGAATAIVHAGLQPVLADVDPCTGMPSPATISKVVDEVGGVSAMVVVHLGGLPTNVTKLARAASL